MGEMMSELTEKLRKMAGVETSALYSQRATLNEAAKRIDDLEDTIRGLNDVLQEKRDCINQLRDRMYKPINH